MSAWVIWLIAAGVLAIGEMFTLALVLGMTALGAVAASGVAAAGGGPVAQLAAFGGVSALLLLGLRPLARRHLTSGPTIATGIDALIGEVGTVLEPVDGDHAGRVKIRGEIWSARVYPGGEILAVGTKVRVLRIDGATAVVHPTEV